MNILSAMRQTEREWRYVVAPSVHAQLTPLLFTLFFRCRRLHWQWTSYIVRLNRRQVKWNRQTDGQWDSLTREITSDLRTSVPLHYYDTTIDTNATVYSAYWSVHRPTEAISITLYIGPTAPYRPHTQSITAVVKLSTYRPAWMAICSHQVRMVMLLCVLTKLKTHCISLRSQMCLQQLGSCNIPALVYIHINQSRLI